MRKYKEICHLGLKFAEIDSSPDFTLHELHVVIKELKTSKRNWSNWNA